MLAWVIEAGDTANLYIGECVVSPPKGRQVYRNLGYVVGWQNALRFSRKEDAEIILRHCRAHGSACNESARVAEHEFLE